MLKIILLYFIVSITSINKIFADENTGLLKGIIEKDGVSGQERIRKGDIHLDDIPNVIHGMINIFIGIAGTVSVVFVIIGAYKILFGAFEGDHTKGRNTITMAITGFAISVLAWFIVKFIFSNFG